MLLVLLRMHTENREFSNQQEWAMNTSGSGMSMIREIEQLKKEICWSQRVFISVHVRPPTCPVNSSVFGGEAERKRACVWSPCVFVHLPCICILVSSLSRGKATWDEGHVWLKIYLKRKKSASAQWVLSHEEQTFLIRLLDDMTHDVQHLPAWGREVRSFPLSKPEFAAEASCVMCRRAPRKCVFTFISRPVKQTHCMCPSVSLLHRSMSPSARLRPPALVVVEWVETYFNAFHFVIVKKGWNVNYLCILNCV